MQCMKCGREIGAGAVFCDLCLDDMAKYPVKPGTVVLLPKPEVKRPPERRTKPSVESQMRQLKKQNRILSLTLALAMLVIAGMICLWLWMPMESGEDLAKGQNYSSNQPQSSESTE